MGSIRHALTTAGIATLLALNGCGGSAAPKEVAATGDEGAASSLGTTSDKAFPTQRKQACEVLTQEVAKTVLGSVGEETPAPPQNSNDEVSVSSCVRANAVAGLDRTRSVSLLMRAARSVTGAQGNESVFQAGALPSGAMEVRGYGDAAFWNPTHGQLNILRGGNWYILSSGPIDPKKHTLAGTKPLADAIMDQL